MSDNELEMVWSQRALIATECQRLAHHFAWHADKGHAADLAALFTEQGCFERTSGTLRGRPAIEEAVSHRPSGILTRHLCTTTAIDVLSQAAAKGITYFQLYRYESPPQAATLVEPAPLNSPVMIGEYHDDFVLAPEGWRISQRKSVIVFRRAD